MNALIIRGTTLRGAPLDEGTVVDLDEATFHLLKSQGQAVKCTPELLKEASRLNAPAEPAGEENESEAKAPKASKAAKSKPATEPQ